jgi:predicted metal-dependent hydrolase
LSPPAVKVVVYTNLMTLEIKGAGKVLIERSGRVKRMRITVKPGSVSVALPKGISFAKAISFVQEHEAWIRHHLTRLEHEERDGRELLAGLPPLDAEHAKEKIAYRFKLLAMEYGFAWSRLTIRNQKTRWGSCSAGNDISLNIQLARLPETLMDYVILHELVHTRIKGHGRDFWQELDAYVGDARKLRRELKRYMLKHM